MNDDNKQMTEERECQPNFINEFQRKHYEACMKARELSRRQPLSAAQLKEQAQRLREITNAESPAEKKRLRADFARWIALGRPAANRRGS